VLPLDENTNSIGCLTCHDPHSPRAEDVLNIKGVPSSNLSLQALDKLNMNTQIVRKMVAHPIGAKDTFDMVVLPDQTGSEVQAPYSFLRYEGSELCVLCHVKLTDLPGQPHDPATFGPGARNTLALNPSIGSCRVCHTTHSAQGPHLWAWAPVTPKDSQIHNTGQIADLCGSCHRNKMGIQGSVHDPQTNEWAQKLGYVSKGSCLDCHPVHDPNDEGGIWSYVKNKDHTSWSCETCHRDGGPGKAKAMETSHIGKRVTTQMINQPENMMLTTDGRITCTTCHDIHQKGKDTKLLVAPVEKLCGTCHEDKLGILGSIHDPGTADWAKKDLGFVSKGSCIDCHPPHGPKNKEGIWAAIIKDQGAPAQSCETCHWLGGPGKAVETPHMGLTLKNELMSLPENIIVDPNMQILCVTCHDIHQKEQGLMLLAAPRGDSGICLVCHPETSGLIGTDHDLRTSAPDALNLDNETAVESGPCGSCHKVHGTSGYAGVWVQSTISKGDLPSAYCTCCHSQGKCAARLIPKYSDHPDVALLNRTHPDEPGYIPTFDRQAKLSRTGAISCLTCHEPHTASSNPAGITNHSSFLRPMTYQKLCVDCHGVETLWRFLYYHEEKRNPHPERDTNQPSPLKE
jgi:predicted CXXCH cytochrome family protein